eukprot:TRINITY_DN67198_c8_g1_i1.p1 TRINITY_DN67198_c8_g1~~TRINITY_DN67198_c8_g1_i1.p1  ORF type:complete len:694 (+),score=32.37 TRINITY_DN67198_c8_g1_i1:208-2082(+)
MEENGLDLCINHPATFVHLLGEAASQADWESLRGLFQLAWEKSNGRPPAKYFGPLLSACSRQGDATSVLSWQPYLMEHRLVDEVTIIYLLSAHASIMDWAALDALLQYYKENNRVLNAKHWSFLITVWGESGQSEKIATALEDMRAQGLEMTEQLCSALLTAWGHTGHTLRMKNLLAWMPEAGLELTDDVLLAATRGFTQWGEWSMVDMCTKKFRKPGAVDADALAVVQTLQAYGQKPMFKMDTIMLIWTTAMNNEHYTELEKADISASALQAVMSGGSAHLYLNDLKVENIARVTMERLHSKGLVAALRAKPHALRRHVPPASYDMNTRASPANKRPGINAEKTCKWSQQFVHTVSTLVKWYNGRDGQRDNIDALLELVDRVFSEGVIDWEYKMGLTNQFINVYTKAHAPQNKIKRILQMLHDNGLKADIITITPLIMYYSKHSDMQQVEKLRKFVKDNGLTPTLAYYTALLSAYARTGDWDEMKAILREMKQQGTNPDDWLFKSVMFGITHQPDCEKQLEWLWERRAKAIKNNELGFHDDQEILDLIMVGLVKGKHWNIVRKWMDGRDGTELSDRNARMIIAAANKQGVVDVATHLIKKWQKTQKEEKNVDTRFPGYVRQRI